ncbi:MAG: hypothetical protein ACJA09_003766 [Alcanivorax sp.]|jgi:hypothetical protein
MAMKRARVGSNREPLSEMLIIDTFTKLIFGDEVAFSDRELSIVQALRLVDANLVQDSHLEMGAYLRALAVSEMISLVSQVKDCLANGLSVAIVDSLRQSSGVSLRTH